MSYLHSVRELKEGHIRLSVCICRLSNVADFDGNWCRVESRRARVTASQFVTAALGVYEGPSQ
jgi:hypothetical protein